MVGLVLMSLPIIGVSLFFYSFRNSLKNMVQQDLKWATKWKDIKTGQVKLIKNEKKRFFRSNSYDIKLIAVSNAAPTLSLKGKNNYIPYYDANELHHILNEFENNSIINIEWVSSAFFSKKSVITSIDNLPLTGKKATFGEWFPIFMFFFLFLASIIATGIIAFVFTAALI